MIAPERPKSRNLSDLWALLRFALPYRYLAVGAVIALIVAAAATLAVPQALRHMIDSGLAQRDPRQLDIYFAVLLVVVVIAAIATFARFYMVSWLGERVVADIRRALYDHVIGLSPGFFEVTRTGEVLSRITTDTTLIQTVVGTSASMALRNFLMMIGGIALLFVTSVKLTIIVLLIVMLVVPSVVLLGRRVRRLSRASQDRVADISAYAGESIMAIQTVQSFTHEPVDRRRFAEGVESAFVTATSRIRARAILTGLVILLAFGAVDAVMWIGGKDVFAGRMSSGDLTAFIIYAVLVAGAAGALSEVWGDLQRAAGAAERIGELLATTTTIHVPTHPIALPARPEGRLSFEAVTFHYPARPDTPSLSDISFELKPGQRVALVGPSGAGKSTIFQLLLRFYDCGAGAIRLDGIDIAESDPSSVRAKLGVVSQDPVIFAASAADNIRYGRPDASDADVKAAAKAAAASEFIERLPEGYDTFLGERGVRLSGGERQRIAIARAILRDPAVLLLDEATSALDAASERVVQDALDRLLKGRTTLVIAHRLATVLEADRILVLDKGRLVASGTHSELIAEGGLYAKLAALQFDVAALGGSRESVTDSGGEVETIG
jgi:ATP-binding cassette subfamily B protein